MGTITNQECEDALLILATKLGENELEQLKTVVEYFKGNE